MTSSEKVPSELSVKAPRCRSLPVDHREIIAGFGKLFDGNYVDIMARCRQANAKRLPVNPICIVGREMRVNLHPATASHVHPEQLFLSMLE